MNNRSRDCYMKGWIPSDIGGSLLSREVEEKIRRQRMYYQKKEHKYCEKKRWVVKTYSQMVRES